MLKNTQKTLAVKSTKKTAEEILQGKLQFSRNNHDENMMKMYKYHTLFSSQSS